VPRPYDPEQQRRSFDDFVRGFLDDECKKVPDIPGRLASCNMSMLVQAWLVNRAHEVEGPLRVTAQWFEQANAADEKFGEDAHFDSALRNDAYGLCLWMLNASDYRKAYRIAVEHWEQHFEGEGRKAVRGPPKFDYAAQRYEDSFVRGLPFEPNDILHGSLADYLASCVQCGEFARGAALYERVGGNIQIGDSRIQTDVHLGYWLCKHGRVGQIPMEACPRDVVKRAYEFMPKVNSQGIF